MEDDAISPMTSSDPSGWMVKYQQHPPGGFDQQLLDVPPLDLMLEQLTRRAHLLLLASSKKECIKYCNIYTSVGTQSLWTTEDDRRQTIDDRQHTLNLSYSMTCAHVHLWFKTPTREFSPIR